jgi:hypothetical protein
MRDRASAELFYLQHAMGLTSSPGPGIALTGLEFQVVVFYGDSSLLMNPGGLTTLGLPRTAAD